MIRLPEIESRTHGGWRMAHVVVMRDGKQTIASTCSWALSPVLMREALNARSES